MDWWLAITVLFAAAVAYAYREHTRHRRRLAALFASLAEEHQGEVRPGSLLVLPQLRFAQDGKRFLVTAMANSGAHEGARGPFTLVDVELPADSGQQVRVERRAAGRTAEPGGPGAVPAEGLHGFEDAFRIRAGEAAATVRFLDAPVREKLMASRLPRLEARVEGRKVSVHMDGIAASREEIEELIEIASLLTRS
jgi:cbb3-type cytochrome oxidase subunit 3